MLDKNLLKELREDIDAALHSVRKAHGLASLKVGNCSYAAGGSFTFKLEGQIAGGKSKEASMYESWMQVNDELPPLGTQLTNANGTYTIEGMNTTGTKVYASRGGVQYLLKTADVERMWRKVNPNAKPPRGCELVMVPPPPRSAA